MAPRQAHLGDTVLVWDPGRRRNLAGVVTQAFMNQSHANITVFYDQPDDEPHERLFSVPHRNDFELPDDEMKGKQFYRFPDEVCRFQAEEA